MIKFSIVGSHFRRFTIASMSGGLKFIFYKYYIPIRRRLDRIVGIRKRHILICGYPRTGTSLLYNMLSTTLKGFKFDEWERHSTKTIKLYDNHATKNPLDVFEVKNLAGYNIHDKEIIIFILIRDIRDIITSIHPYVPNDYYIGYEGCYRVWGQFPNYKAVFDLPGVGEIFREIDFLSKCGNYNVDLIKYEDLVNDTERIQEDIARKYFLSFRGSFTEFHKYKNHHAMKFEGKRRSLESSLVREDKEVTDAGIGRWRLSKHRERVLHQFSQYPELFKILRIYGYTQDDNWFQDFAGN